MAGSEEAAEMKTNGRRSSHALPALLLALAVISSFCPGQGAHASMLENTGAANFAAADNGTSLKYPVMPMSAAEKRAEAAQMRLVPAAAIDEQVRRMLTYGNGQGRDFSLLPLLNYIPAERNQNPNCGNCWVWTGTGILEIALNVQKNIRDRFSIQYFNSVYREGRGDAWACCGGNPSRFVDGYRDGLRKAVPWSNGNAAFRDGPQTCIAGTAITARNITATPYYMISSIGPAELITTHNVQESEAILNIKNVLHQNRAVYFAYGLASREDWQVFQTWWDDSLESAIWDQGYSCGKPWTLTGGRHAVLCVGYNDEDPDPAKHYWLILNSWGSLPGRPNGLFRVPMHYDYNCADAGRDANTLWWTIPVTFADNIHSRQVNTPAGTITISTDTGSLDAAAAIDPAALPAQGLPPGAVMPYGIFTFTENDLAPGATVRFTLTLPGAPPAGLQMWKYNDGQWVNCTSLLSGLDDGDNVIYLAITDGALGDTDDAANGSIVDPCALLVPLHHMSIMTSGSSSPPQTPISQQPVPLPNIYVRSAAVVENEGAPRVSAEAANTGAAAGVGRIVLYIDGQEAQSRGVSLDPGRTVTVSFDITDLEPGTHEVSVNNTPAGKVIVKGGQDRAFIISLTAFSLIFGTLVWVYLRKRPS
jgi:hypothetical protein